MSRPSLIFLCTPSPTLIFILGSYTKVNLYEGHLTQIEGKGKEHIGNDNISPSLNLLGFHFYASL